MEDAVILMIFGFIIYIIPTIVAYSRNTLNKNTVFVLNLFLGWTVIGWIICLAMAFKKDMPTNINLEISQKEDT